MPSASYRLLEEIGTGSFGMVYKAIDLETNDIVAVKKIDLEQSLDELAAVQKEVITLSRLSSPYVIRYLRSWTQDTFINIVMEFGTCSVFDILRHVGPLDELTACYIIYQVVKGLCYLHDTRIIHRDLKSANILITETALTGGGGLKSESFDSLSRRGSAMLLGGHAALSREDSDKRLLRDKPSSGADPKARTLASPAGPVGPVGNTDSPALSRSTSGEYPGPASYPYGVKLCDFGVAAQITATMSKRHTFVGSPHWLSPEIIKSSKSDYSTDIWSLGITTIELLLGHPPYHDQKPIKVMFTIPNAPPPVHFLDQKVNCSKHCKEFVAQCLVKDPGERPTAQRLLLHKWFRSVSKMSCEDALRDVLTKYKEKVTVSGKAPRFVGDEVLLSEPETPTAAWDSGWDFTEDAAAGPRPGHVPPPPPSTGTGTGTGAGARGGQNTEISVSVPTSSVPGSMRGGQDFNDHPEEPDMRTSRYMGLRDSSGHERNPSKHLSEIAFDGAGPLSVIERALRASAGARGLSPETAGALTAVLDGFSKLGQDVADTFCYEICQARLAKGPQKIALGMPSDGGPAGTGQRQGLTKP